MNCQPFLQIPALIFLPNKHKESFRFYLWLLASYAAIPIAYHDISGMYIVIGNINRNTLCVLWKKLFDGGIFV